MTTAQDPIPQQEPLFLVPPLPTPTGPQKKALARWHVAVLIVGVPLFAFLSCVGANTVAHWYINDAPAARAQTAATSKPKPHKSKPAGPRYNLAGYRSAITGPEEQAFASRQVIWPHLSS